MTPLYYKYPSDGYNWWKVIVQTGPKVFVGTVRVYPNGYCVDPIVTAFTSVGEGWEPLILAEAIRLTSPEAK